MSVLTLQREDALPDPGLDIQMQLEWSALRSGRSGREILAYAVISDSGKLYETEIFLSDTNAICGFCNCKRSELSKQKCRHVRAVLADVLERQPDFGETK